MALRHARPAQAVTLLEADEHRPETTSALVKADHFEAIHLVVSEGQYIPPHKVAGPLTLYCLEGIVDIELDESVVRLASGQWLYLEGGAQHAVRGVEISRLLLTIILLPPGLSRPDSAN